MHAGIGQTDYALVINDQHSVWKCLNDMLIPGFGHAEQLALFFQIPHRLLIMVKRARQIADLRLLGILGELNVVGALCQKRDLVGCGNKWAQDFAIIEAENRVEYQDEVRCQRYDRDQHRKLNPPVKFVDIPAYASL